MFGQFIYKNNAGRVTIIQRLRFEQRFIEQFSNTLKVGRFRHRLALRVPINNSSISERTFFGVGYNEIFISFGERLEVPVFNQNRAFIGAGYKFTSKFSFIIGYLNQYIIKLDDVHIESNNTLSTVIAYNLF